jgi:hypothetical protein
MEARTLLADGISPAPAPLLQAVAGISLADAVFATYTVNDPLSGPGDQWRALINFGDGQVDGPLLPVDKGEGFAFVDTHTYRTPGTYTVTVMIAVPGSMKPNDNTVTTQVVVTAGTSPPVSSAPPSPPRMMGRLLKATVGRTFRGPVAHLIAPQTRVRQLTALISWGDESPPTAGRIRSRTPGHFLILGTHSYTVPGRFNIQIAVKDEAGQGLTATSVVQVNGPA